MRDNVKQYVSEAKYLAWKAGLIVLTQPGVANTPIRTTWDLHERSPETNRFLGHFRSGPALLKAVKEQARARGIDV